MPGPEQRERINQIIFDELVNGQFLPRSLAYYVEVIRALKDKGCDAVVLGCTEIPLLVTPELVAAADTGFDANSGASGGAQGSRRIEDREAPRGKRLPKPPLIFVVLYVLLAAISVVAIDLRLLLVPAASAVLVLVAAGFVVFRPFRTVMAIPWPAHSETEGEQTPVVINGNACHCQGYEQDLLIEIVTRHLLELLTCLLLAGATLCAIGVNMWRSNHFPQIGAFQAEFICMAGLVALLVALRWFTERDS